MSASGLSGILPYLVSPLNDDQTVNAGELERLCNDLVVSGVHGLVPLGSTGEFAYLTWEQRQAVVQAVVRGARGRVPVVAGVAATTIVDAQLQAKAMQDLGCDAILAILEAYFPVSDDGVYAYFAAIANAVTIPIVLYTNPSFQRSDLSIAVIERLSKLPNIRAIKDASSNTGRLLSIMNAVGDRMDVFSASAHIPTAVMLIGGAGWMAGPACLIPRQSVALYNLCVRGAWAEAMVLQRALWSLNEAFAKYNLAACIKAGLRIQGYDVGGALSPAADLSPAAVDDIGRTLQALYSLPHPT